MTVSEIISLFTTTTIISSGSTFLAIIIFYFLNHLYKKQLNHIYNLSLEKYKSDMQLENNKILESIKSEITKQNSKYITELEKVTDITFRDEIVRTNTLTSTIDTGNNIRVKIFTALKKAYFNILYSHNTIIEESDKDKQAELINDLYSDVKKIRIEIFANYIYLGPLIDYLITAQIGLWDDIAVIQSKIDGTWNGTRIDFDKSSEGLHNAEKWIMENMKTYLTINEIELTNEQIEKLQKEQNRIISEINKTE